MNYSIFINLNHLLTSDFQSIFASQNDINEITNAKKMGVKIILYSSRHKSLDFLKKFNQINFDYLIYNDYQCLYDFKKEINILENENSKKNLIDFLLKEANLDLLNSMSVGQKQEDLFILQKVKFSYAIANSELVVNETAKYHTSDIEQNAISEAIVDFTYRNKIK